MSLKNIYNKEGNCSSISKLPIISYEVFPPKGEGEVYEKALESLFSELQILKKFNPAIVSVTYGAGGSTQEKTFDIVKKIKSNLGLNPMPHFTCVNADRDKILDYIKKVENEGIKNILALRGDPPQGCEFEKTENGFGYAKELVEFIKDNTELSIAVAGYPEKHPEAASFEADIENLKNKVEAGADAVITQLFFDNDDFYKFYETSKKAGVNVPIIPGVMPITSFKQIERMTTMCGANIPKKLMEKLVSHQEDKEYIVKLGVEYASEQVRNLVDFGVQGLHMFPLNKSYSVKKMFENVFSEFRA